MAKNSIMMITPVTCHMMAKYHATDSPEAELRWLRIGIVLFASMGYNNGPLSEEDLHGMFDLAFNQGNDDNLRERGYELLS